ncbi:MAG: hypothetical protein U1E65_34765 [Myxococcota bacterium]
MVPYQPPDPVLLMIGATFRLDSLRSAALRISALAAEDTAELTRFGIPAEVAATLEKDAAELGRMAQDAVIRKHDTPLQMAELQELMARVRGWLAELRDVALLNVALDRPAVARVVSPEPEIRDGYARDLLQELQERVAAAKDLRPRLDDVGMDEKFLGRGRKLVQQLQTAIGKEDVGAANLQIKTRRFYMKKGQLYMLLKRTNRAAQCAFRANPGRRDAYHLEEIEPDPLTLG